MKPRPSAEDREAWARRMAAARFAARQRKDWPRADQARRLLVAEGYEVRDTRDGVALVPRNPPPTAT